MITIQDSITHTTHGLSSPEVAERLQRGETNAYQARVGRTYWHIFRDNLLNLFNIVLFTLLIVVLYLRDYPTFFFAGFSVISNTFLGMIQEMNAKRKLDQLTMLAEQKALVWRDGQQQEISKRDVVLDDVLILEPGMQAVVDGEVLQSDALEMDESQLTGESDAIYKSVGSQVLSGTFCVAGTGVMRATHVGRDSQINQMSTAARIYRNVRTPTQRKIDIIVELSVIAMLIFVPLLFVRNLVIENPPLSFLQAARNAVVFVTTLVPQGLVLTAALSLTIGAIKISRQDTLVQKVNAVESLANATVLCFDKTGTLTENKLVVETLIPLNGTDEHTIHRQLATYLANLAHLNRTASALKHYIDPLAQANSSIKEREIPFNSERKWGAIIFPETTCLLGAPELLFPEDHEARQQAIQLSAEGKRVLAFGQMDGIPQDDQLGHVDAQALIILSDQIRPDIHETLAAFRTEEIVLKVISGDNLATVRAVANATGIDTQEAYTGDELVAMSESELQIAVQRANVFARVDPQTKRRIVAALQANREYVAMIGDGVNDVPALKQANLAITMFDGAAISRDIADLVLLKNNISTLPMAFSEGTKITQTIFATTRLFMTRAVYHVALFVLVMFMALPFPLTPVQIGWATFGSINMPASLYAIGFLRPKRMRNFRDDVLDPILIGGFVVTPLMIIMFLVTYISTDRNLELARSAVMMLSILVNAYIVLTIQGVDFYQPRTFFQRGNGARIMLTLVALALWISYIVPSLVEYTPLSFDTHPLHMVLLIALFELGMILIAQLLHNRYLIERLWALLAREDATLESP